MRGEEQGIGAAREREAGKAEGKRLFGEARIGRAILRLCRQCEFSDTCLLFPLTTKGKDCPYFKKKRGKK